MSMENVFGIAGSALNAQLVRLNLTASNIANAGSTATNVADVYKSKKPVFQTILDATKNEMTGQNKGGVKIEKIVDDQTPGTRLYDPSHPQADKDGYLYKTNVNEIAEMVEMMAAARSYQNNVEVINTARELMTRTIDSIKN